MRKIYFLVCISFLIAGCASGHPEESWHSGSVNYINEEAIGEKVRRIAVLNSWFSTDTNACTEGMIKQFIHTFSLYNKLHVKSYNDVRSKIDKPIELPLTVWSMEKSLAEKLGRELKVDILCVLWVMKCGHKTGDRISVVLFSAKNGDALARFKTARPGLTFDVPGEVYSYDFDNNARSIAQEAVEALIKELGS